MSNPLALPGVDIVARGRFDLDAVELRGDGEADGTTLCGYFSTFDDWYEINSIFEGRFMESFAPGAYMRTIKNNRSSMVVAFDHGMDPTIADKPLGPIDVLREDKVGPWYEVPLYDTAYNRDFILPVLQGRTIDGRTFGSGLGCSFRFRVIQESWNEDPGRSDHNPEGLPERTITEARVFEFGPVVYPANPEATAGVRSLTDHLIDRAARRSGRPSPLSSPVFDTDDPTVDPLAHSTNRDADRIRLLSRTVNNYRKELAR